MPASKSLNALGVLAAILLFSVGGSVQAKEWKVEEKLEGKADTKNPGKIDKSQNVSGIACNREAGFPRHCIVIDDEVQRAQVVIVHDDKIVAGQTIQLISDSFQGKPLELDGEGVAYDDGYFYVIGSHGSPRKSGMEEAKRQARMRASGQLVRFRIDKDQITKDGRLNETPRIETTSKLRQALKNVPELAGAAEGDLNENGLTIEGVAVKDGVLYAGLRAPALEGGKAAIVSVAVDKLFNGDATAPDLHLDLISVGKDKGVRDLVRYRGEFIVLAGPAGDLAKGDPGTYFVVRWPGSGDVVGPRTEVDALPGGPGDDAEFIKPEAILVLDEDGGGLRILVLNDGASEGRPRTITMR